MIFRIIFFTLFWTSLFSAEHVYLKAPNFSRQEIIGTTVGIRPYRKTGVRLEAEWLQEKLVIHNYGYGGSGLTLSWGGSYEVLEILNSQEIASKSVAVLGAGVVGLATAYDLLENGYEVHLYSEKWSPDLTSNVAAGIWTPLTHPEDLSPKKKLHHEKLQKIAEHRFLESTGDHPEFSGVRIIAHYRLPAEANQETRSANQGDEVIVHFDNGVIKHCRRFYRLALEGKVFMEDLFSKVKSKGALLQQRHFENLDEVLALNEPVIINCMSIGSREIFNDQDFIPARGQMIHFAPQGIDYMLSQHLPKSNYVFFIYPWNDRLLLGGVFEYGEEELTMDPEVIDELLLNAEKCLSESEKF